MDDFDFSDFGVQNSGDFGGYDEFFNDFDPLGGGAEVDPANPFSGTQLAMAGPIGNILRAGGGAVPAAAGGVAMTAGGMVVSLGTKLAQMFGRGAGSFVLNGVKGSMAKLGPTAPQHGPAAVAAALGLAVGEGGA